MKYFLDTEFLEGKQVMTFGKNTIDLISIGIVSETDREYYAISKDFNLEEAWNRYDVKQFSGDMRNKRPGGYKEYWVRDNVLLPMLKELEEIEMNSMIPFKLSKKEIRKQKYLSKIGIAYHSDINGECNSDFGCCSNNGNYWLRIEQNKFKRFQYLLEKHGKTNKEIAEEIKVFCGTDFFYEENYTKPEFYAYFADYDWVVFCWLFGRMIDLPKEFPKYCKDLKQIMDSKVIEYFLREDASHYSNDPIEDKIRLIKNFKDYPKQTNEHNALDDAKWNKRLYEFLVNLK